MIQPRGKLGVKFSSNKAMEFQVIGVTTEHHLPCGYEGEAASIKTTSDDRETSDNKGHQTQETNLSGKSNLEL